MAAGEETLDKDISYIVYEVVLAFNDFGRTYTFAYLRIYIDIRRRPKIRHNAVVDRERSNIKTTKLTELILFNSICLF